MTPASSWLTRLRRPIAHARPAGPRGQRRGLAVPARVALIGATRFTRRRRRPIVWSCPGRPLGPTAASSKATGSGLGQAHQSRRRITGSDNRRSPTVADATHRPTVAAGVGRLEQIGSVEDNRAQFWACGRATGPASERWRRSRRVGGLARLPTLRAGQTPDVQSPTRREPLDPANKLCRQMPLEWVGPRDSR